MDVLPATDGYCLCWQEDWQLPVEGFELRLEGTDDMDDDEGMFEMSETAEGSDGHVCVVNDWLNTHDNNDDDIDDAFSATDEATDRCSN